MSTLDYLINDRPSLRLRFLQPGHTPRHGATRVTEVVAHPLSGLPPTLDTPFESGTLFLATLDAHRLSPSAIWTLDQLIRLLDRRKAASRERQRRGWHGVVRGAGGLRATTCAARPTTAS